MKRRDFIRSATAAAAGAFVFPYILPSGRLFARSNDKLADHVVLVLFAGGVRQQESVLQGYLEMSQNEAIPGNIMYNLLNGAAPTAKIVYGTDGSLQGEIPIPKILGQTLQSQGTLFREMRASSVGHYGGLNVCLQGNNFVTQGLKQKPVNPTIFEYLRRHGGYKATDTWFVGNGILNSVPLLNYSTHPDYGAAYGGNFLAPTITFSQKGFQYLADAKVYHPENELDPIYKMKYFLDNTFGNLDNTLSSLGNTEEEKQEIKEFIRQMFIKTQNGTVAFPPVSENGDARTIGYACEVMKWFKPALTVVNLNDVDGCHSNFTGYLRSLHRADHAVGHLWDFVQTQIPDMAGNTILVMVPECGRNLDPNPILDDNDWYAYDHSDANAQRIFGMMAGPNVPVNMAIGNENNPVGISADMVPTVAEILGVKDAVLNSGHLIGSAASLFDRI
jgi:hypothetical protein